MQRDVSAGAPVHLVLLPGLDGTDVFLRPLLACLPPTIVTTTITFPDDGPYCYPELLALIRERLSDLPPAYLLACSFSGPLAAMLVAAMPERLRGVIFVATFLRSPRPSLIPLRFAIRGPLVWALRMLRRLPVWARAPEDAMRVAKRETWGRVSARGLAARARAILAVDAREAMRDCRGPVLCVAYESDRTVASRWSEEIVECCPSARRVMLAGGHLGMFEAPQALADEVVRFITSDARLGER